MFRSGKRWISRKLRWSVVLVRAESLKWGPSAALSQDSVKARGVLRPPGQRGRRCLKREGDNVVAWDDDDVRSA